MSEESGRFGLPQMEALSSTLRTTFVNLGFFAATLLLIPAVASQMARNAVVIDPIVVPQALIDRGVTPEVAANRLWDGLQDFARTASIARATIVAVPDSQLVEFSLPDTGLSLDSILKQVRQFFGAYETHIAGEIVCETADCATAGQRLRLRVIRATAEVIDLPPIGSRSEAEYFREAAAGIYDILDPFVAIAARAATDPDGAATHARRLALTGHPDAPWAFNLLGDIERNAGRFETAAVEYRAALDLDPNFTLARLNLARALAGGGELDAAATAIADAPSRDPESAGLFTARAELDLTAGNRAAAVEHLLAAAEAAPLDPDLLVEAGTLELALGRDDEAVAHLEEALDLEPGHPEALRILGESYREKGNVVAAERLFQDWADYAPNSAEAHLAIAELLAERGDLKGAAPHYDRVVVLAPENPEHAIARARVLLALGRYAQAVDGLAPFADADPPQPEAVLLLAEVLEAFGRPEQAAARYRQVLSLDADGPGRRIAEAALARLP
jgi:predicted Zn-dependent protease